MLHDEYMIVEPYGDWATQGERWRAVYYPEGRRNSRKTDWDRSLVVNLTNGGKGNITSKRGKLKQSEEEMLCRAVEKATGVKQEAHNYWPSKGSARRFVAASPRGAQIYGKDPAGDKHQVPLWEYTLIPHKRIPGRCYGRIRPNKFVDMRNVSPLTEEEKAEMVRVALDAHMLVKVADILDPDVARRETHAEKNGDLFYDGEDTGEAGE